MVNGYLLRVCFCLADSLPVIDPPASEPLSSSCNGINTFNHICYTKVGKSTNHVFHDSMWLCIGLCIIQIYYIEFYQPHILIQYTHALSAQIWEHIWMQRSLRQYEYQSTSLPALCGAICTSVVLLLSLHIQLCNHTAITLHLSQVRGHLNWRMVLPALLGGNMGCWKFLIPPYIAQFIGCVIGRIHHDL